MSFFKLSKNFSSEELRVSKDHPKLAGNIILKIEKVLSAQVLAVSCLQPTRDKFGKITVLSWIRDEELNKAVGGSDDSDHLTGCAADIYPVNFDVDHVFKWLVLESNLPFRQVIYYPEQKFIHISCNHPLKDEKHEALISVNGKYIGYNEYYS